MSIEEKGLIALLGSNKGYSNMLISAIKDSSIDYSLRVKMAKALTKHDNNHDELVDSYIKLINTKNIDSNLQNELIKLLIKLTSESYCLKKIVIKNISIKFLIANFSLKSFFELLSDNRISLKLVVKNAFYRQLPLYLKKNNLCSVERGMEIITINQIDKKELNKIVREILT